MSASRPPPPQWRTAPPADDSDAPPLSRDLAVRSAVSNLLGALGAGASSEDSSSWSSSGIEAALAGYSAATLSQCTGLSSEDTSDGRSHPPRERTVRFAPEVEVKVMSDVSSGGGSSGNVSAFSDDSWLRGGSGGGATRAAVYPSLPPPRPPAPPLERSRSDDSLVRLADLDQRLHSLGDRMMSRMSMDRSSRKLCTNPCGMGDLPLSDDGWPPPLSDSSTPPPPHSSSPSSSSSSTPAPRLVGGGGGAGRPPSVRRSSDPFSYGGKDSSGPAPAPGAVRVNRRAPTVADLEGGDKKSDSSSPRLPDSSSSSSTTPPPRSPRLVVSGRGGGGARRLPPVRRSSDPFNYGGKNLPGPGPGPPPAPGAVKVNRRAPTVADLEGGEKKNAPLRGSFLGAIGIGRRAPTMQDLEGEKMRKGGRISVVGRDPVVVRVDRRNSGGNKGCDLKSGSAFLGAEASVRASMAATERRTSSLSELDMRIAARQVRQGSLGIGENKPGNRGGGGVGPDRGWHGPPVTQDGGNGEVFVLGRSVGHASSWSGEPTGREEDAGPPKKEWCCASFRRRNRRHCTFLTVGISAGLVAGILTALVVVLGISPKMKGGGTSTPGLGTGGAGGGVGGGSGNQGGGGGAAGGPAPPPSPPNAERSRLDQILDAVRAVSSADDLADTSSPQHRAAQWLAAEDPARVPTDHQTWILQRYVATVLYFSTGGPSWTDDLYFLSEQHECQWHKVVWDEDEKDFEDKGLFCDTSNIIFDIILFKNGVSGKLPMEISSLFNLHDFLLWSNRVGGPIPPALGDIERLRLLDLGQNRFTGTIPKKLAGLRYMEELLLDGNLLEGGLPPALGNMAELRNLNFGHNGLGGTLPSNISKLQKLRHLQAGSNFFTGPLPSAIGLLKELQVLDVSDNSLDGTIPSGINALKALTMLDMSSNQFEGGIPLTAGGAPSVRRLRLFGNRLSGPVPDAVGTLVHAREVLLDDNALTGTIPASIGDLESLSALGLSRNLLTGTIPGSIAWCPNLLALLLGENELRGTVPRELVDPLRAPGGLEVLSLERNMLGGTIPPGIGALGELTMLGLSSNQFEGTIPKELGDLSNLRILELGDNRLKGAVPEALGGLGNLEWLSLQRNDLTGDLSFLCGGRRHNRINHLSADSAEPSPEVDCVCCTIMCSDDDSPDKKCDGYASVRDETYRLWGNEEEEEA